MSTAALPTTLRTRFAPTPSRPLHLGNALAAAVVWAAARAAGGTLVMRIEDIDRTRCRPEYEAAALEDLRWLGLDWDEGPDIGGPFGPYRQSERMDRYTAALGQLETAGAAYACQCSRAQVRAAQRAPHLHSFFADAGGEKPYPGTCRPPARVARLRKDRGGMRLNVHALGDSAIVTWRDRWQGERTEDVRTTCGDFLLGRPGHPTYQLAAVADDIAMGITDVVRGADLMGSTARQVLLHRALGAEPPRWAHHPLVVDERGRKLSKRDKDLALTHLRERGEDPQRVLARVAAAVGWVSADTERLAAESLPELLAREPAWRDGPLIDPDGPR